MSEWIEIPFSEFVDINPMVKLPKDQLVSYVEMKDITDGKRFCFPNSERFNGSGAKFQEGDTLFARITPCLENGKIAQASGLKNGIGLGSTEFLVFRGKKNTSDNNFVYYLSRWNEVRAHAEINLDGTSGRQRVPKECFNELIISVPTSLIEQSSIADVLSSLDDKIDLLHRQNETLEKMAETLFRKWFVEEAEEEWEMGTLGEVIEIYDNLRVPLSKMERDKMKVGLLYPYYGAAKIMDYINDFIFDGEYILMGEDGTVRSEEGYPVLQYAIGKFWVNNHTHVLKAKSPFNNFFVWNYLRKKNIDEIVTGAVQPKINQTNLKSLEFPKYPNNLVTDFNKVSEPLFKKINQNTSQIQILTALRETLLPKLMSEEVKVELKEKRT